MITFSCQKEAFDEAEPQAHQQEIPDSKIRINVDNDVTREVVGYLKNKTNNTLQVTLDKGHIALSDSPSSLRESAMGTVDVSKEISYITNRTQNTHLVSSEMTAQTV